MPENCEMNRRRFIKQLLGAAPIYSLALAAMAQPELDPNNPRAVALGYQADHRRVDVNKWPKKARPTDGPQRCDNCAMRNGDGGCQMFRGSRVSANGWCNAWTAR